MRLDDGAIGYGAFGARTAITGGTAIVVSAVLTNALVVFVEVKVDNLENGAEPDHARPLYGPTSWAKLCGVASCSTTRPVRALEIVIAVMPVEAELLPSIVTALSTYSGQMITFEIVALALVCVPGNCVASPVNPIGVAAVAVQVSQFTPELDVIDTP